MVWALRRQGIRVRRSPGIELAHDLLAHAAQHHWRVALVGASPAVMGQLSEQLPLATRAAAGDGRARLPARRCLA